MVRWNESDEKLTQDEMDMADCCVRTVPVFLYNREACRLAM